MPVHLLAEVRRALRSRAVGPGCVLAPRSTLAPIRAKTRVTEAVAEALAFGGLTGDVIGVGVAAVGVVGAADEQGGNRRSLAGRPASRSGPQGLAPHPDSRRRRHPHRTEDPASQRPSARWSPRTRGQARTGPSCSKIWSTPRATPRKPRHGFRRVPAHHLSGGGAATVLGNHDYMNNEQGAIMETVGRATPGTNSTWEVRVIVLDTEQIDSANNQMVVDETVRDDKRRLDDRRHAETRLLRSFNGSTQAVQDAWVPLFEKYDIPLVLAGHDHKYQRSGRSTESPTSSPVVGDAHGPRTPELHRCQLIDPALPRHQLQPKASRC